MTHTRSTFPTSTLHRAHRAVRLGLLALTCLLAAPTWAALTAYNTVVDDSDTHLSWDRCAYGLSDSACSSGTALRVNWADALTAVTAANAAKYKGYDDWRLPNRNELDSLVKRDILPSPAALSNTHFPATPTTGGQYDYGDTWTSTPYSASPTEAIAFTVLFRDGSVAYSNTAQLNYLRLVRGGTAGNMGPFDLLSSVPALSAPVLTVATSGPNATLSIVSNPASRGSWMVVPSGSPAPTAAQVTGTAGVVGLSFTSRGGAEMAGAEPTSFALHGLSLGTSYDLYMAARNGNGLSVLVGPLPFTTAATPDTTAPVSTVTTISNITSTGATANLRMFETGVMRVALYPANRPAPSVADMQAYGFPKALVGDSTGTVVYTTLTPSTAYVLYTLAQDNATPPNVATTITGVPFTTLPDPAKTITGTAPGVPGAGPVTLTYSGGYGACAITTHGFASAASIGGTLPAGISFPQGVVSFSTNYCGVDAQLSVTLTYSQAFPPGTRYYKYDGSTWAEYPGAVVHGNTVTLRLTDNTPGDTDPRVGYISDPGGPGVFAAVTNPGTAHAIPTLSEYGLMLLVALMGWLGMRSSQGRRHWKAGAARD